MTVRKKHTPKFKLKVSLEALKGKRPINEIASNNEVAPTLVSKWKKEAVTILEEGFRTNQRGKKLEPDGFSREELLQQIGELKVELDWLRKKL